MKLRPDTQVSTVTEKDPIDVDEVLGPDLAFSNVLRLWRIPPFPARLDARIVRSFLALRAGHANIAHQGWVIKSFAVGFLLFLVFGFGIIIGTAIGFMSLSSNILLAILAAMVGLVSLVFKGVLIIITARKLPVSDAKEAKSDLVQPLAEIDEVQGEKINAQEVVRIQRKRRVQRKVRDAACTA